MAVESLYVITSGRSAAMWISPRISRTVSRWRLALGVCWFVFMCGLSLVGCLECGAKRQGFADLPRLLQ
jgi:hypothetical protein